MRNPHLRVVLSFLMLLTAVPAAMAQPAPAFEHGALSWQKDLAFNSPTTTKVTITMDATFQRSFPGFGTPPQVSNVLNGLVRVWVTGNGYDQTFQPAFTVQTVNATGDWFSGTASVDVVVPNTALPLEATFSGCCRLSTVMDSNPSSHFRLFTIIDPSKGTRSPTTTITPRVYATVGAPITFGIPSSAYNGYTNYFSLAQGSGLISPAPVAPAAPSPDAFAVSQAGVVSWRPASAGLYQVQFLISSKDSLMTTKTTAPVEVIFEVLPPCPTCPQVIVTAPTNVQTYVGHDAKVVVSAFTTVVGNVATLANTPLPSRAHLRQLTSGQTSTYEVSWTPIPGESSTLVCFQGIDQAAGINSLGSACTFWDVGPAATIGLTGVLRTFQSSHPDMNRPLNEAAAPQTDFVAPVLGADTKPVQVNAAPGVTQFAQWFNDVAGVNQSSVHSIYLSNVNQLDPNLYQYNSANWQPSDGQKFFTYEAHTAITYAPGRELRFKSTGDMWVFINRMRVPGSTLHGVHNERTLVVPMDMLGLVPGESYPVDVFYAHRGATTIPSIQLHLGLEPSEVPDPEMIEIPAGGFSAGNTTLLGDAQIAGGALRLLPSAGLGDSGAGWVASDVQLQNGFSLEFDYVGTGGFNAEGFAVTAAPAPAIGAGTSGLGYDGISRSLAVEFDVRQSAINDPAYQHISVHTAGVAPNSANESASIGLQPPNLNLPNSFFNATAQHVRVSYTPVTEQGFGWIRVWMNANVLPAIEAMIEKADVLDMFGYRQPTAVGFTAGRGANTSLTVSSARLTTFPDRNTPPTILFPFGVSVHEGIAMQAADMLVIDAQHDPIEASVTGLPDGLSWSLVGAPTSLHDVLLRITGTPAVGTGGFHHAVITLSDGRDSAAQSLLIVVNAAPHAMSPMANLRINEDATPQVVQVAGHFADVANQALALSVESDQPWLTTWMLNLPDRVIIRPEADAFGVATVTVRATDTDGESVTQTFTVTVDPVNDPPVMALVFPPVVTNEDAADTLVPIAGHFSDLDDATLTYTAVSNSPVVAATIDGGQVRLHLAPDQSGAAQVTVRASDASGLFVESGFTVTINPVDDPPPPPPTDDIAGRMHGQVGFAALGNDYDVHFKVAEKQIGIERGSLDIKIAAPKSGNKKASANRFESTAIAAIVFSDDPAFKPGKAKKAPLADTVVFTGTGTWNGVAGYRFEAKATDQGEPGPGRDRFAFTIYDGSNAVVATADMAIGSGNIQSNRLKR